MREINAKNREKEYVPIHRPAQQRPQNTEASWDVHQVVGGTRTELGRKKTLAVGKQNGNLLFPKIRVATRVQPPMDTEGPGAKGKEPTPVLWPRQVGPSHVVNTQLRKDQFPVMAFQKCYVAGYKEWPQGRAEGPWQSMGSAAGVDKIPFLLAQNILRWLAVGSLGEAFCLELFPLDLRPLILSTGKIHQVAAFILKCVNIVVTQALGRIPITVQVVVLGEVAGAVLEKLLGWVIGRLLREVTCICKFPSLGQFRLRPQLWRGGVRVCIGRCRRRVFSTSSPDLRALRKYMMAHVNS